MIVLALRIGLALILLSGGMLALDNIFGTDVMGAIWRLIVWFWVRIVELVARFAGKFSGALATWLRTLGQKALIRKLSQPLWRLIIMLAALFIIGKARRDRAEAWVEHKRVGLAQVVRQAVDFRPSLSRNVRAAIALTVIIAFVGLFVWISENIGKWWGLGASVVLWTIVEKVHLVGLDALASFIVEKWAPVKALIGRHPWLRWLWLGPVFDWLAKSVDSFSERHADRNQGKSSFEVWREKRRRRVRTKPLRRATRPGPADAGPSKPPRDEPPLQGDAAAR
ncbi:MAG: hypothetical protein AB7O43_10980 [Hyphomicrobiaceae bacterium]